MKSEETVKQHIHILRQVVLNTPGIHKTISTEVVHKYFNFLLSETKTLSRII